jgi:parallel beta-helix repeat protein
LLKRTITYVVTILFFLSGVTGSFRIESARAESTIVINGDGSISPATSQISTIDNITYTFVGNISNSSGIWVLRNSTIIDGNGYTLEGGLGESSENGFHLSAGVNNVTIKDTTITNFTCGILLDVWSFNNTVANNNISSWLDGIYLLHTYDNTVLNNNVTSSNQYAFDIAYSSNNIILNNNFENGQWGILLAWGASNNILSGNNIIATGAGIWLTYASSNKIFHNNFINNTYQAFDEGQSPSTWDNGVEGNYWSDYNGTDSDQDGIGDTPYVIPATVNENNTDHYPLMGCFQSFNVVLPSRKIEEVDIVSNLTVQKVKLGITPETEQYPYFLNLTVSGQNETGGFFRLTFPNELLNSLSYPVYVEGSNATLGRVIESNDTQTTLYFNYTIPSSPSNYTINILPEFPFPLILSLFIIATLLTAVVLRKRHLT